MLFSHGFEVLEWQRNKDFCVRKCCRRGLDSICVACRFAELPGLGWYPLGIPKYMVIELAKQNQTGQSRAEPKIQTTEAMTALLIKVKTMKIYKIILVNEKNEALECQTHTNTPTKTQKTKKKTKNN